LRHETRDSALLIHQGVYQLLTMISPYLGDQQREFYQQVLSILQAQTGATKVQASSALSRLQLPAPARRRRH
jgi:hypothetical protein